jgi:serine protease Do
MKHAIYTIKFAGLLSAFALRASAIEAPAEVLPEEPQAQADAALEKADEAQVERMPFHQENAAVASAYFGLGSSQLPEALGVHLGLKDGEGVLIRALDPDGPATKAGFTINDVITKFDALSVGSHAELTKRIMGKKPGDEVSIDYIHEGKPGNRKVILGLRPDSANAMGDGAERPVDRLLECMPQDQAKKIRESIERSINGAFDLEDAKVTRPGRCAGDGSGDDGDAEES